MIRDYKTGESLQYAFIEFAERKSCEEAYFKMDNVLIDDRRIHVDFSQSVAKYQWRGKGKGVKVIEEDKTKTQSKPTAPWIRQDPASYRRKFSPDPKHYRPREVHRDYRQDRYYSHHERSHSRQEHHRSRQERHNTREGRYHSQHERYSSHDKKSSHKRKRRHRDDSD